MPALTSCIFEERDFTGAANCNSIEFGTGGWAWVTWTFGDRRASLARVRNNSEIVIPLTSTLDTPANRSIVDSSLPSGVSRITGIRAGMVPYSATFLGSREPARHPAWRVFIDLSFRVRIDLPWYCFAPGGDTRVTVHYYILVSLDSGGRLRANVDQWEWNRTESAGVCGGEVADRLNSSIPGGIGPLQAALNSQLEPFMSFTFADIYFLPGDGRRSGRDDVSDVRTAAAIVLIR
ncbi:hypothetical protein [Sphaerothrix gracilis]|uniref:hypothetical protein n=1 Tax=Sphaerothrix gracilis TaxID=3151835 RepID=UPI0031FC0769